MLKFNSITKTDGAAIRLVASQLSNSSFPRVLQALAYRFAQTHTHARAHALVVKRAPLWHAIRELQIE